MRNFNRLTAVVMALVILFTMSFPVFASSKEPQTREEYAELLTDEGYPAITTDEFLEKLKAVADFFRLMTGGKFPSSEKIDITFDKFLTEANLYVVSNSGVDMEKILRNLPPISTPAEFVVNTFDIDTVAFREEMYRLRDESDKEGTGLGALYHFIGAYMSIIDKIEVFAEPTDDPAVYQVCFNMNYRDGGYDTLRTGMYINTETGDMGNFDGRGMLGLGFNFNFADMIVYTVVDAWTRDFGFAVTYDVVANAVGIYDYVTRRYCFEYDGLEWRIQVWKGTYFYVTNGAEIGIYSRVPGEELGSFYNCADDSQMMEMEMTLFYKDTKLFSIERQRHWWLTGFHLSGMVYEPESLTMEYSIVFPAIAMRDAFIMAVDNETNRDATYEVNGTTVSIIW